MKQTVTTIISALAALSLSTIASAQSSGCFWANTVVGAGGAPGNPLQGSGFGQFSGTFSSVNYYSGSGLPTNLAGTWSVNTGWDTSLNPGISWSSTVGGIKFDTNPGDVLLFGNPTLTFSNLPKECKVDEIKLLTCIIPDSKTKSFFDEVTLGGGSIFVRNTTTKELVQVKARDFSYQLGTDGDGRDSGGIGYDSGKSEYSTADLTYAYDDGKGGGITDISDNTMTFDTILKVGACITCVPETSSSLLAAFGAFALLRRRR